MASVSQRSYRWFDFIKMKSFFLFVIRSFLLAVLILFLLLFVFFIFYFIDLFYNMKTGKDKFPLFGAYVIVSPSMEPTILVQDAIVVQRVDEDKLGIGTVITFSSSDPSHLGLTVTHRIVGRQLSRSGQYVYRTKGDNNVNPDSALVTFDRIYGRVVLKIPKLGYIQKFLTRSYGAFLFIILPAFLIVLYDIIKIGFCFCSSRKVKEK